MKLAAFQGSGGEDLCAVVADGRAVDVSDIIRAMAPPPQTSERLRARGIALAPGGIARWLQCGQAARQAVLPRLAARQAEAGGHGLSLGGLALRAPVARPGKIVGVGRNYADHARETGVSPFEKPRIIFKMSSSVIASGAAASAPPGVRKFDFEGELAAVVGDFVSRASPQAALKAVAGYTLINDLSAREFQFDVEPPQTTFAKSMDGFCPMGPVLATSDAIADPQRLVIETRLNGQRMQHASTCGMLFPVAALLSYMSGFMTLEPGDVVATGTPAGIGAFRTPARWLVPGDRVEVRIAEIGTLETPIR